MSVKAFGQYLEVNFAEGEKRWFNKNLELFEEAKVEVLNQSPLDFEKRLDPVEFMNQGPNKKEMTYNMDLGLFKISSTYGIE